MCAADHSYAGAEAAVGVVGGNAPREDGMAEGTDAPDDAVALDDTKLDADASARSRTRHGRRRRRIHEPRASGRRDTA